jgi:hypothetical protein
LRPSQSGPWPPPSGSPQWPSTATSATRRSCWTAWSTLSLQRSGRSKRRATGATGSLSFFAAVVRSCLPIPASHRYPYPGPRPSRESHASSIGSSTPSRRGASFGSVLWQIPRSETERARLVAAAGADPDRNRHVVEQAAELARRDPDQYFDHGLETILTGLEARRSEGRLRQSGR